MEDKDSSARTYRRALARAREILSDSASLVEKGLVETEAEQLAIAALREEAGISLSRLEFFSNPERTYPEAAFVLLEKWCRERATGRLLQHLTGRQVFLDHEYEVGPEVLIPRPETEILVLHAIETLKSPSTGIEIGLGSGIIAIELLSAFPGLSLFASEVSSSAVARARSNASKILGSEWEKRLTILSAPEALDVWGAFEGALPPNKADFLVSNPPYVSGADEVDSDVLSGEPSEALFPARGSNGCDPLHFYKEIAQRAEEFVRPGGWVFCEIPHERAQTIAELFTKHGWAAKLFKDLTGRERVLAVRLSTRR